LVDAHAHLDKYGKAIPRALGQIREHSILTVAVSMDVASFQATQEIARLEPLVLPSFGIHPWEAPRFADHLPDLDPLIADAPLLGEVGLDHFFVEDPGVYPAQAVVFSYLLDAAEERGKIVNLHTKGAEAEVIEHLQGRTLAGTIVHWYSGPLDLVREFLDLGAFFTIGVEVMRSEHIRSLARMLPLTRILTETDNPGGWEWMQGELGFPELLNQVETSVARLREMDRELFSAQVTDNMVGLLSLGGLTLPERNDVQRTGDP